MTQHEHTPGHEPAKELGDIESGRMESIKAVKLKDLQEYLANRLGENGGKTAENLWESVQGLRKPAEAFSELSAALMSYKDPRLLAEFSESLTAKIIPQLVRTARRRQIKDVSPLLAAARTRSREVPEAYRAGMWGNIALPLLDMFGDDAAGFETALRRVGELPASRYTDWSKRKLYGERFGEGMHKLLSSMPRMSSNLEVIDTLCSIMAEMANPKRAVFMETNGPRMFSAIKAADYRSRTTIFRELVELDGKAAKKLKTPRWEFLRLHGAEAVEEAEAAHAATPARVRRQTETILEALYAGTRARKHKAEPVLITKPEDLVEADYERFRREVRAAGGWADVIVHPHASERWIDWRKDAFLGEFGKNTGRNVQDYRTYTRYLDSFLADEDTLKVILCDNRNVDETAQWVRKMRPSNSVLIIPTLTSDTDENATPRHSDVVELTDQANRLWFDRTNAIKAGPDGTWEPVAELLKRLGVVGLRMGGEYAYARIADGKPTLDSEGNMNLQRYCVEGARRNLLPHFDVSINNNACFPDSTLLPPTRERASDEKQFAEEIIQTLPGSVRHSARRLCENAPWALILLSKTYRETRPEDQKRLEDNLRDLSHQQTQNFSNIAIKAIMLSRDIKDPDQRIDRLNHALETARTIRASAPTFGMHPRTDLAMDEISSLGELTAFLQTAAQRAVKLKTAFGGDILQHISSVAGRLTSPVRTTDGQFAQELENYGSTIRKLKSRSFRLDAPTQAITSLITYHEEIRALTREGIISGLVFYPEAGADITALAAAEKEKQAIRSGGREQPAKNTRLLWYGSNEFELRHALTLAKALGHEDPSEVTGPLTTVLPTSRELAKNLVAIGRNVGATNHIRERLKKGHETGQPIGASIGHNIWEDETRALQFQNMDVLQGHTTDLTPVAEYLGGAAPDTIILKGLESWAFSEDKTQTLRKDSPQLEDLNRALDNLTALTRPGTKVLVSSSDPNIRQYFQDHTEFEEEEPPPIIRVIQADYPKQKRPIYVKPDPQAEKTLKVRLARTLEDLPDLLLIPEGRFTVFARINPQNIRPGMAEQAQQKIVSQRGTPEYGRALQSAEDHILPEFLHYPNPPEKEQRTPGDIEDTYVREELMKTRWMMRQLQEKTGTQAEKTIQTVGERLLQEGTLAAAQRGLERHPQLWERFRRLDARIKGGHPTRKIRVDELEGLRRQIAIQTIIEEEAYPPGKIPPSPRTWATPLTRQTRRQTETTPKQTEPDLRTDSPDVHQSLRNRLYERLGLTPDEND